MVFGGVRRRLRRLRSERGATAPILVLKTSTPPEVALALRAGAVLLLIGAVFTVFLLDRGGLTDNLDGHVSVADVLYFTMITITTVGYGDIVPVSDQARLIDAFFVLVEEWRMTRLQQELQGHVVLCGYGDSGSVAAGELLQRGWAPQKIVVIDSRSDEIGRAAERGFIGLHGNASSEELLHVAAVPRARAVIVSVGRDDTTVLVVLTIREMAKQVRVIARVGEEENVKLVRSSGADVIVSPPRFGGCLMADAVESDGTVDFISEMLSFRGDYQLQERAPRPEELGRAARELEGSLVVEVLRGGRRIGGWADARLVIEAGDRLLVIDSDAVLDASG